jgi:hypothetical protein
MSVIVIANYNARSKYYEEDYPRIIKSINLKPIFMYDIDLFDNKDIKLNASKNCSMYENYISYSHNEMRNVLDTLHLLNNNNNIIAFIPYTEEDVMDSDFFNNHFKTPSNPIDTSICRRNKYYMQDKLKIAGLKYINQEKCTNLNELINFVKYNNNNLYVIKPICSAASEDVYMCKNIQELEEKFLQIIDKTNNCGLKNTECLIQEFIDGDDWIVNSVSRNGKHKIVNVMKSNKSYINDRHFMYLYTELIEPKDVPDELLIYAKQVLDVLDIQNGAGHAEIKMSSNGPCLIEIGARVGGGQEESAVSSCIVNNYGQLKASIYSYCNAELFNEIPDLYVTTNNKYICITFNCLYDNLIWNEEYINIITNELKLFVTVHKINCNYITGDILNKTQDLCSIIARIFITSTNYDNLKKAIEFIKQLENNIGIYPSNYL